MHRGVGPSDVLGGWAGSTIDESPWYTGEKMATVTVSWRNDGIWLETE